MTNDATPPIPSELRADLVRRIEADIVGPSEGPTERLELGSRRVRDRYLAGMLAPRDTVWMTSQLDDEGNDTEGEGDGEVVRPAAKPVLMPSAFGLSFAVAQCTALEVTASWGRYVKEREQDEEGKRRGVWQREPIQSQILLELPPADGSIEPMPIPAEPDVVVEGRVRTARSGVRLVTLFLVNGQLPPQVNKDSSWLFQAKLVVRAPDGSACFVGRPEALGDGAAQPPVEELRDLAILDLQYRDNVEFAVGHAIATHAERAGGDPRRAVRLETVVVPHAEVPRTEAPSPKERPELGGVVLDMKQLAEANGESLRDALTPLVDGYSAWLGSEAGRVADPTERLTGHEDAADDALERADKVLSALREGVELIASDLTAADAFRFANRAMWHQRVRSEAVALRRLHPDLSIEEAVKRVDIPEKRSWRPFQLAFVCLNAPSLTDPHHVDRTSVPMVDLLFFPTGGGKTEAYLGLVAYCFAIRRLQAIIDLDDGQRVDGRDGVAVFMRYTLRALTTQQFERAAALVCSCEMIRRADPERWGAVPFRLGMWVGAALAPNRRSEAKRAVEDARAGKRVREANPLQLSACPWCGETLELGRDVDVENGWDRTLVYCPNAEGSCPFTKAQAEGEGIPVVTVDEEIYRLLPSFFIATVDKFAQLPWKGPVRMLFGRVTRRCTRHGYRSVGLDQELSELVEADTHQVRGSLPKARTDPCDPLRPPDLIIQDELHLITGPLGTMAGLYETAIDRLATWRSQGFDIRPKIVASTATIRRAESQAWNVFERRLRLFPPPVLDVGDSFFARQVPITPETPGRLYLGVCAHSRRLKEVENRVFSTVMAAAQALYNEWGAAADPWMTTVGYFNAIRELAGMKRLSDDELRKRLLRGSSYPGLADRSRLAVEEMTSRISSSDIRPLLDRLRVPFDPNRLPDADERPVDLLLATNMISVGVDVPRLGLMIAVGQPKSTAEYIQATSRVGRSDEGPGLVVTILNWTRPRDLSHYERFEHYHATYYRQVEPLSVTPFADRAVDRGLTAVLVGLLRGLRETWNPPKGIGAVDRHDPLVGEIIAAVVRRATAVVAKGDVESRIRKELDSRLDALAQEQKKSGSFLTYEKTGKDSVPLLKRPEAEPWQLWTCPMSMRTTEPNVNLLLEQRDPAFGAGPAYRLPTKPAEKGDAETQPVSASEDEIDPDAEETAEVPV